MPEGFDRVELGAVFGQRAKMEAVAKVAEPVTNFWRSMISGVVMDQEHLLSRIALGQAAEEGGVAGTFKHVPVPIVELRPIEIHRSKNFLRVPLAGGRNQRLLAAMRPRLIEAGVLAETGFIGEQQGRVALCGFFLAEDRCSVAIGFVPPDRLWPTGVAGAEPKTPAA